MVSKVWYRFYMALVTWITSRDGLTKGVLCWSMGQNMCINQNICFLVQMQSINHEFSRSRDDPNHVTCTKYHSHILTPTQNYHARRIDQKVKNDQFFFQEIFQTHRKSGCDNLKNVSSLAYLTSCVFNDRADFVKSDDRLEFDQSEDK